jgi:hypothetical protein
MEGFNAIPYESWTEQAWWYQALSQATERRLSTPAAYNDYASFWYTHRSARSRTRPTTPRYEYVLSRFGALDTGRKELYRHGPVVLSSARGPST